MQGNTIIGAGLGNCYRMLASDNAPSLGYDFPFNFSPQMMEESETSSCVTPLTMIELDGKCGRDETTDSISCNASESDVAQKKTQTSTEAMRVWYESRPEENDTETKSAKRSTTTKKKKVVLCVDMLGKADTLRQDLLVYVYQRAGRPIPPKQVLKLTAHHEKEKLIRFNQMCPRDVVIPCIEKRYGQKRNHFPLCIDQCPHSPVQVHNLFVNTTQWIRVQSPNPVAASQELKRYVSSYSNKQTRGRSNAVVKYSDLRLNVCVNSNDSAQPLATQQLKIKVMKHEYYNKIRTPTPKSPTQPLNLTYARFWVEVVKDFVYLSIVDIEALKSYDEKQGSRRPIKSAIGAYVDGRMEVELAIMSSFAETEVAFEWFVHKDYTERFFQKGITVGLHLTGNKEMRDWNWCETVTNTNACGYDNNTNAYAYGNTSHNQWSSMGYGLSGAPHDYSLPSHIIQPFNNSYEQNWPRMNYGIQETIPSNVVDSRHPTNNYGIGAPMLTPTMTTPSPTLENLQAYEPSPINFDGIRTETLNEERSRLKRKRNEMENETGMEMEADILPFSSKRPVDMYRAYDRGLTPIEENARYDENPRFNYELQYPDRYRTGSSL